MITSGRMSMRRHSSKRKEDEQQQDGIEIHEATNAMPNDLTGEVSQNGKERKPNPHESYRKLAVD